jgi:hypothetical protein
MELPLAMDWTPAQASETSLSLPASDLRAALAPTAAESVTPITPKQEHEEPLLLPPTGTNLQECFALALDQVSTRGSMADKADAAVHILTTWVKPASSKCEWDQGQLETLPDDRLGHKSIRTRHSLSGGERQVYRCKRKACPNRIVCERRDNTWTLVLEETIFLFSHDWAPIIVDPFVKAPPKPASAGPAAGLSLSDQTWLRNVNAVRAETNKPPLDAAIVKTLLTRLYKCGMVRQCNSANSSSAEMPRPPTRYPPRSRRAASAALRKATSSNAPYAKTGPTANATD